MIYQDDGKGFDAEEVLSSSKRMGLFNIRNRIESLNGEIEIVSKEGTGIHVSVILPLKY
jgi:signal transduction histidine kinase